VAVIFGEHIVKVASTLLSVRHLALL